MIRLGIIDYLNTLPVYHRILKGALPASYEMVHGTPAYLNRLIASEQLDVSVVSSFEYAQHAESYYLFPNLSVSADGPVHSIYLFAHQPFEELEGVVRLPSTSLTSIHLLQYLLRRHRVSYVFSKESAYDAISAELLIGDEAIRVFHEDRFPYCYDLSERWKDETQLPFVFAVWVVRKAIFHQHRSEVMWLYELLQRSKEDARRRYASLAKEYYRGIFPNAQECEHYLRNLKYDFSPTYQDGFSHFQASCREMGWLSDVAPLQFLPLVSYSDAFDDGGDAHTTPNTECA